MSLYEKNYLVHEVRKLLCNLGPGFCFLALPLDFPYCVDLLYSVPNKRVFENKYSIPLFAPRDPPVPAENAYFLFPWEFHTKLHFY